MGTNTQETSARFTDWLPLTKSWLGGAAQRASISIQMILSLFTTPSTVSATSTLVSSLAVQYITATTNTVQTFPTSGAGEILNIGTGGAVGELTLTPPSGKKLIRNDGTELAADAPLYSSGLQNERLRWGVDVNGNVQFLEEGLTLRTTP